MIHPADSGLALRSIQLNLNTCKYAKLFSAGMTVTDLEVMHIATVQNMRTSKYDRVMLPWFNTWRPRPCRLALLIRRRRRILHASASQQD